MILHVLGNVPPFLFIWYLRDTLRCNLRNRFSVFLTVLLLLMFLNTFPSEQIAKSFTPKSIPKEIAFKRCGSFCSSILRLMYQYLPSNVILGL